MEYCTLQYYGIGHWYSTCIHLCLVFACVSQPESQKKISHSELTVSYPRYPDVFHAMRDYASDERLKLMVC